MASKPIPLAYKKRLADLMRNSEDHVSVNRLLARLANHEAVVRMLTQAFPTLQDAEIRKTLAESAAFFTDLHEWAQSSDSPKAPSDSASSEGKSSTKAMPSPEGSSSALQQAQRVKVFIDGGSKGNPGPAAIGIVFTDVEDNTLFEEALCIGETTNNVAEYTALITALKILTDNGVREAYFFSDSELLVRQVTGVYKIKSSPLMRLASEAQALRRKLTRFQIVHIPREQNRRADQLANLAFKQAKDASVM